MKRKILLAALFSTTAILAAIGLATEKSQAGGWPDEPIWGEAEITAGYPYLYEVPCTEIVGKESYYDSDGTIITTVVTQTTPRTAQGCALVSTGQCTPSLPC